MTRMRLRSDQPDQLGGLAAGIRGPGASSLASVDGRQAWLGIQLGSLRSPRQRVRIRPSPRTEYGITQDNPRDTVPIPLTGTVVGIEVFPTLHGSHRLVYSNHV